MPQSWRKQALDRGDDKKMSALRERLQQGILAQVEEAGVNGDGAARVPNTTNIHFDHIDGEALVIALDLKGIAVSTGAACSSGAIEPSHVLVAMGLRTDQARASIRFSLGKQTTAEDIDFALALVPDTVARLRELSPVYKKTALSMSSTDAQTWMLLNRKVTPMLVRPGCSCETHVRTPWKSGPLRAAYRAEVRRGFSPCGESRSHKLNNDTIAVAMSGGVDSSTVAAMLRAEGHNVIGLTMQLWNQRRLAGHEGMPESVAGTLLLARRRLRRAPRRPADRHPVLRGQS